MIEICMGGRGGGDCSRSYRFPVPCPGVGGIHGCERGCERVSFGSK